MRSTGSLPSGTFEEASDVTLHITANQIKTLASSPVILVGAPGPGRVIRPKHLFVQFVYGTVPFISGGSVLRVGASAGNAYWTPSEEIDLGGLRQSMVFSRPLSFAKPLEGLINQPLVLTASQDELYGPIAAAEVDDGGTGYSEEEPGSIVSPGGDDSAGTYEALSVDEDGVVTELRASGGTFFVSEVPFDTSPAESLEVSGSGLRVRVTEVAPQGDGQIFVTVDYDVLTLV